MKELNDIVTTKITDMISSGKVEEIISKNLEKTIADSIESAIRSYSDFGKDITAKIEESIKVSSHSITIPAYNEFIKQVVLDKFNELLQSNAAEHLAEIIEAAIPPVNKEEKTSKVIARISEEWLGSAREQGNEEITIITRENDEATAKYVTIVNPNYGDNLKVIFYNFRDEGWHIGYIRQGGNRITDKLTNIASLAIDSVTQIFFQYYAMGTIFEFDEEFKSIYVGWD